MDAIFQFLNGPEGEVVAETDKLGNVTVTVKPRFRDADARPTIAYAKSVDSDGDMIDSQVLSISGKTGTLDRRKLKQEVIPSFEVRKKDGQAPAPKTENKVESK